MLSIVERRAKLEVERLSTNYKKRNVKHNGWNSGDLRRIQAIVYIFTGCRRSLEELDKDIREGENLL